MWEAYVELPDILDEAMEEDILCNFPLSSSPGTKRMVFVSSYKGRAVRLIMSSGVGPDPDFAQVARKLQLSTLQQEIKNSRSW